MSIADFGTDLRADLDELNAPEELRGLATLLGALADYSEHRATALEARAAGKTPKAILHELAAQRCLRSRVPSVLHS